MATYTDSSLATYTNIASSCNHPRNHAIDTITIHCVVGQWTAKQICDYFAENGVKNQNSCNYGVGKDGSIGLCVHEEDRSWCSSSASNDHRAITIECASDTTDPYAITDAAYNALIKLCADICKRNGIKKLIWSTSKTKRVNHTDGVNMTCHRDFANKACPGDYIYNREGDIADAVNAILNGESVDSGTGDGTEIPVSDLPAVPFTVKVIIDDLNYRSKGSMSGTVNGQTGKGTFTITEVNSSGWGKLKSGAGWIYLLNTSYCTIGKTVTVSSSGSSESFLVKVTISDLNIRKGPGTDYAKTGKYTGKGTFTIVETSDGEGSTSGWGKLKSGAGWISLDYAAKV